MSLQTSGWVGHQFDDGVFGGKRVPSDPCFIIIFWAMPELVPRIFSCARKGDLQVKHDLQGLDQAGCEKSLIPRMLRYFVQLKIWEIRRFEGDKSSMQITRSRFHSSWISFFRFPILVRSLSARVWWVCNHLKEKSCFAFSCILSSVLKPAKWKIQGNIEIKGDRCQRSEILS